jgi:hypothetical protein
MNGQERSTAVKWGVIGIAVLLVAFGALVAWVQINFGPTAAVISVGSVIGVMIFWAGIKTAQSIITATHQNTNVTLQGAADFVDSIEQTRTSYARGENERARLEREKFVAQARLTTMDAQDNRRIEQQRVKLLVDAEKERLEARYARQPVQAQPAESPLWADADDGQGFKVWS